MKKQNPISKTIFSTIGIILITSTIGFVIILPSINYIKNIKKEIQTIEKESADQYQKIKLMKKSIAELDTVREKSKLIEQALVDKNDAVKIIQELEDLAIDKKIEQSLSINSGTDNSFVFSFKTKSNFSNTIQYLNSLEHLPFYMIIDNLSWTKVDKENVSLTFQATVFAK